MIYEANIKTDSEQSQCSKYKETDGGGHNWEKYFIGLFHVSENVDCFKPVK